MRGIQLARILTVLLVGLLSAPGLGLGAAIKGKVVFFGAVHTAKKVGITIGHYVSCTAKDAGDLVLSPHKELRNAVVWIDNPPANAAAPAQTEKIEMDQNGCVFIPRIVIVPAGGTVDFLNSDRLLHKIRASPKLNASFNRTQPKSRTIPITFDKPEIVRINCELHSWMLGWVVVGAHPFYAITGEDGQFTLDNLPPGQYKLQEWHERLGTAQARVTIGDQHAGRVTVDMKAP